MSYTKVHADWGYATDCCAAGPDPGQPNTPIRHVDLEHIEQGIFDAAADADTANAALAGKLDSSALVQTVTNGDTTHVPSADAVFDAVAGAGSAAIVQTITNGDTTHAPSGDAVFDALALKADLASPALTGNPTAPTAAPGDNDTSIATTAFVTAADAALIVDSIADSDATHAPSRNAVFDALALKAPLASPALTGNPTAPTPAGGDNDTSIATTAFVQGELTAKAPLASPSFTGNPTAPTASPGDNDTSIATTAFVTAADAALIVDSIADSDTTHAPSRNAVFDALALKANVVTPTSVKTSAYTAAVSDLVLADATSGGFTITLPTTPVDKATIQVERLDGSANTLTLATGGSDKFYVTGGPTSLTLPLQYSYARLQYDAVTGLWHVQRSTPRSSLDTVYPAFNELPIAPVDPRLVATASPLGAANRAIYIRIPFDQKGTISKIGFTTTASGSSNVDVGVYSNTGTGRSARPNTRLASSGSVAAPTGYGEPALTASIAVSPGDWLAIAAASNSTTFHRTMSAFVTSDSMSGFAHYQETAFPLPATATPNALAGGVPIVLLGLP